MDVGKAREQERKLCPWMNGMPQGAMEGDAVMPMDGRYDAKSQGWRCVDTRYKIKNLSPQRRGDAEEKHLYFLLRLRRSKHNTKFFSASPRLCG